MCDLKQPKPASGPTLCHAGQELVVRCVMQGNSNAEIRKALQREHHYSDLSDHAFVHYRKLPIVKEARAAALTTMRDVGTLALSRRMDKLEKRATALFDKLEGKEKFEPGDEANLTRTVVIVCKEISRLVDVIDPDGLDGIPNTGEKESAPVSVAQVLQAFEALTIRKRKGEFVPNAAGAAETAEAEAQ